MAQIKRVFLRCADSSNTQTLDLFTDQGHFVVIVMMVKTDIDTGDQDAQ
jgi:hypothetical protein